MCLWVFIKIKLNIRFLITILQHNVCRFFHTRVPTSKEYPLLAIIREDLLYLKDSSIESPLNLGRKSFILQRNILLIRVKNNIASFSNLIYVNDIIFLFGTYFVSMFIIHKRTLISFSIGKQIHINKLAT